MFNEETCSSILKSLQFSNQNFLLQVTPFSTKITIKNSFVNRFHEPPPKADRADQAVEERAISKRFETLAATLEEENKLLKNEISMVKADLNTAEEENITLLDSLNKSESKILELEKSNERADARRKTSLKDFATKIENQRSSHELNLKELKEFKKLKVAEDKKKAKSEKKATKKARKN